MADTFKPEAPDSPGAQANDITNTAIHNLPNLINAVNSNAPASAAQQFSLAQQYMPQWNQLYTDLAAQNLAKGKEVGASSDLAVLNGTGADLIKRVEELDKGLNPQWYTARDNATKGAEDILGSYNLNGLSGGESAAIERANAANNFAGGNGFTPNQLTTVNNAMNFGAGYDRKRSNMSSAVNNLTSTANAFKSSIDPINTVFGRSNTTTGITNPNTPDPMAATNQNTQLAQALLGVGSAANSSNNAFLSSDASTARSFSGGMDAAFSSL